MYPQTVFYRVKRKRWYLFPFLLGAVICFASLFGIIKQLYAIHEKENQPGHLIAYRDDLELTEDFLTYLSSAPGVIRTNPLLTAEIKLQIGPAAWEGTIAGIDFVSQDFDFALGGMLSHSSANPDIIVNDQFFRELTGPGQGKLSKSEQEVMRNKFSDSLIRFSFDEEPAGNISGGGILKTSELYHQFSVYMDIRNLESILSKSSLPARPKQAMVYFSHRKDAAALEENISELGYSASYDFKEPLIETNQQREAYIKQILWLLFTFTFILVSTAYILRHD